MAIAIKAENISKQYRLGVIGTGTLSHDLNRWWAKIRGKEDPTLKIGQTNTLSAKNDDSNYVWALKDINFEIQQGEAVGIIGKNGAGKSTLLKILSKVTAPTTGNIKIKGRIASLLEVGTGFHPELTGRENIFLNGAILGMTKAEIRKKFDEIVDFSGVEKYIDTPVKRYSSGMYVRLAFAVAAHLEPEILVVDEVLAVGDAEFQKKCLGKMKDVSTNEGRTVLFVSHNMQSINTLCNKAILLNKGQIIANSTNVAKVIRQYNDETEAENITWQGNEGDDYVRLIKTSVHAINNEFYTHNDIHIEIHYIVLKPVSNLVVGFHLKSEYGYELAYSIKGDFQKTSSITEPGFYKEHFIIPGNSLTKGNYFIIIDLGIHDVKFICRGIGDLKFFLLNKDDRGCRYPVRDVKGYFSLFRPNWHSKTEYEAEYER